jgi:arylsulfatase A-like enzyme
MGVLDRVLPFEFRVKYPDVDDISLPAWGYEPVDMPAVAWHGVADELGDGGQKNSNNKGYSIPGFDADPVVSNLTNWTAAGGRNANITKTYRMAYRAAVSYQDYNIGKILGALDDLGPTATNTVTLLFGDHGFHLAEQNTYAKYTNFEIGVRIPLIIRAPWIKSSVGTTTYVLAEAIDVPLCHERSSLLHMNRARSTDTLSSLVVAI